MNAQNKLYFIEINTLPGINPNENEISYFPIASRAAGMKYKDLIEKILTSAIKRYYK
jgi:D-alanine-D-alanine ligase-like ATP-grasp enzyme